MSVIAAVNALPTEGLTLQALQLLDNIVPGEWENTTSFDAMIAQVSGETSPVVNQQILVRALAIDAQQATSYGRALQVYSLLDNVDQVAAGAAAVSKAAGMLGSFFGAAKAVEQFTPKPETTQALDAGLKLVGELVAFGILNGVPAGSEGLGRFVGALEDYAKYDRMRIAAWVVFDGVIPLGPDFLGKMIHTFGDAASGMGSNAIFEQLGDRIPGDGVDAKRAFVIETLNKTGDFMNRFVEDNGITQEKVLAQVQSTLGVAGDSLDVIGAAIDATTDYMRHTGTQTVGRHLAREATKQLKDEVWKNWVAQQG